MVLVSQWDCSGCEIVRGLETHPKYIELKKNPPMLFSFLFLLYQRILKLDFVWSRTFKFNADISWLSTKCYFIIVLYMWVLLHNVWLKSCEILTCHGLPIMCQTASLNSTWHNFGSLCHIIFCMSCRNSWMLFFHSNFFHL